MLRNSLAGDPSPNADSGPADVYQPQNLLTQQWDNITGGRATVSLPAPRMPVSDPGPVIPAPLPQEQFPHYPQPEIVPTVKPQLSGFIGINLETNEVIGDDGDGFRLTDDERKEIVSLCIRVTERAMLAKLAQLRENAGLTPSPEEKNSENA